MTIEPMMKRILRSIPVKICLAVVLGQAILIAVLGIFLLNRLYARLDQALAEKVMLPALFYEQGLLNEHHLDDFRALNRLVKAEISGIRVIDNASGRNILGAGEFAPCSVGSREVFLSRSGSTLDSPRGALVPLLFYGRSSGYLHVQLSDADLQARKLEVVRYYLIASVSLLVVSGVLAALTAHKIIVPRTNEFVRVADEVANGNFSSRLPQEDEPDELGLCFARANLVVATLENYINKLHELNDTAGAIANALNRDEVIRIVAEVIEKEFAVECLGIYDSQDFYKHGARAQQYARLLNEARLKSLMAGKIVFAEDPSERGKEDVATENHKATVLYVPVVEDNRVVTLMVFSGRQTEPQVDPVTREFARTLARLMGSSFSRIRSLHEITQAESKYRALFMTAEGGIYRATGSGLFEDINPSLSAMIGYQTIEQMQEVVTDIAQLMANPADQDKIQKILNEKDRVKDIELTLLRRDGSTFPASLSAHTVRNKYGELTAVEGFIVDLTERTLREEAERERAAAEAASQVKSALLAELETKNRQLQESLEEVRFMQMQLLRSEKASAIGAMSNGLAHDLNNFLAGAVSYPELLLLQLPEDSEMRQPLKEILSAGKQAVGLVNDLLALSDETERVWQLREVNGLIEQVMQSLEIRQVLTVHPELRLNLRLCTEPTTVSCFSVPLEKALINLVLNSMKHAGSQGLVDLATEVREIRSADMDSHGLQAGPHVVLSVSDSGPILDQEHHDRLFEPFYSRKVFGSDPERSGLDLTLCWNIVQEHGGTILVGSRDDRTLYELFLPITDQTAEADAIEEPKQDEFSGSGTVLVVDDEPLQREIAGKMLTELGYQAYLVASGKAALEFVERQEVDLVLLDMLMPPGINGRETYEQIVRIRPDQKALIVTGYSKSSDIQKTIDLGAAGLLKKPYTFSQFGHAVSKAMKGA